MRSVLWVVLTICIVVQAVDFVPIATTLCSPTAPRNAAYVSRPSALLKTMSDVKLSNEDSFTFDKYGTSVSLLQYKDGSAFRMAGSTSCADISVDDIRPSVAGVYLTGFTDYYPFDGRSPDFDACGYHYDSSQKMLTVDTHQYTDYLCYVVWVTSTYSFGMFNNVNRQGSVPFSLGSEFMGLFAEWQQLQINPNIPDEAVSDTPYICPPSTPAPIGWWGIDQQRTYGDAIVSEMGTEVYLLGNPDIQVGPIPIPTRAPFNQLNCETQVDGAHISAVGVSGYTTVYEFDRYAPIFTACGFSYTPTTNTFTRLASISTANCRIIMYIWYTPVDYTLFTWANDRYDIVHQADSSRVGAFPNLPRDAMFKGAVVWY